MEDSAAEFYVRNSSVSGKTHNEWHASLYPSTQDADATLANLLGFGSNGNCQEQNYPASSSGFRAGVTRRDAGRLAEPRNNALMSCLPASMKSSLQLNGIGMFYQLGAYDRVPRG